MSMRRKNNKKRRNRKSSTDGKLLRERLLLPNMCWCSIKIWSLVGPLCRRKSVVELERRRCGIFFSKKQIYQSVILAVSNFATTSSIVIPATFFKSVLLLKVSQKLSFDIFKSSCWYKAGDLTLESGFKTSTSLSNIRCSVS